MPRRPLVPANIVAFVVAFVFAWHVAAEPADDDAPVLTTHLTAALPELRPRALYLSIYGIGDRRLREQALELVATTELNSLVVDVKGDYGKIPYASAVALAADVGALSRRTVQDERSLLAFLHAQGIYVIARIVVFKDRLLAAARPEFAVKSADGSLWYDRERSPWVDPFREEVRDYNLDLAVEASQIGFERRRIRQKLEPLHPLEESGFPEGLVFAELAATSHDRLGDAPQHADRIFHQLPVLVSPQVSRTQNFEGDL